MGLSTPPEVVPSRAVVVLSMMLMPTAGLTEIPPELPAVTVVGTVRLESAVTLRFAPPVRPAPFSTSARVMRPVPTVSAIEAPTPTLPPFASEDAVAVSTSVLAAASEIFPVPAATFAPVFTAASVVSVEITFSANEPATPTFFAPAPELETALIVCVPSPAADIRAETLSPFEVIESFAPIVAEFVRLTTFTAMAAPTPIAAVPVAEPSAVVTTSVSFAALTVSTPPDPMERLSAIRARAALSTTFTPIAAAKLSLPSEVLCEGDFFVVPPLEPALEACVFP